MEFTTSSRECVAESANRAETLPAMSATVNHQNFDAFWELDSKERKINGGDGGNRTHTTVR